MFPELDNFLDTGIKRYKENVLFINENGIEEYFVKLYYLLKALKNSESACLVSLKQLVTHYNVMADKHNFNLKKHIEMGTFRFVDGVEWFGQAFMSNMTFLPPLKEFYLNIKNAIGELQSNKNMTLIVDDLSVLSTMGYSISELSSFPQYLRQLVGPSGLVIIATNKGISSENNRLSANLAILADFIITVEPLKTGYCKEITGQVTVRWKNQLTRPNDRQLKRVAHYKMTEKSLSIMPVGLSAAVL